jgi:hypothetical protein
MKHEIIKTENCLLVVDDSEIKEGDYRLNIQRNTIHFVDEEPSYFNKRNDVFKKIIAHLPLNNSPILEGVPLLPPLEDDVDEAKEMEKEQIMDAFEDSRILSITNNCNSGEQYYKETYKQD